jgi:hypothetical protein
MSTGGSSAGSTVVILLSDKRSGSTFLERELCSLPEVQHVNYTPHTYNETHYWTKAARLLAIPAQICSGQRRILSYGSRRAARRSLVKSILANVPDFVPPGSDRELVFSGWEALCRRFAKPIFFEKTPHHAHNWGALDLILEWSEQTEHRVRFVGLVRNPMAVLYSAERLFRTNPAQRQFSWFEANRNILLMRELARPGALWLLRYEDMVQDPETAFKELCAFLGVDYDPKLGNTAHRASQALWRDDAKFTLSLHPSVARLAKMFGYRENELLNGPKGHPTRAERLRVELERGYSQLWSALYRRYRQVFRE